MIYDSLLASVYDRTYAQIRDQDTEATFVAQIAQQFLASSKSVLDLGCGTGIHLSRIAAKLGSHFALFGLDGSESMLSTASARLGARAILARCDLVRERWPIDSRSIGVAYATFNLYQSFTDVSERTAFLFEVARVLAVDGCLVFDSQCEPGFSTRYLPGTVTEIARNGVVVRIGAVWRMPDKTKTTTVTFVDEKTGSIIHSTHHRMLRATWSDMCNDLREAGLFPAAAFADWKGAEFDEIRSPSVVAVCRAGRSDVSSA